MASSKKNTDWFKSIVDRSKLPPELVEATLLKYNIRQNPTIGRPRHLSINRIQFSGKKRGKYSGEFEFEFRDLETGLWGLISDRNLKGKTSVLEIIRWLLRGKPSDKLQKGVRDWIAEANLDFEIDKTPYSIQLNQGSEGVSGRLVKRSNRTESLEIGRFTSEEEFRACMSDFMMREFSLDVVSEWRKGKSEYEEGSAVLHDWPALSGVLFISTNYNAIFGDAEISSLNNRLMRMYLGLPWISTHVALTTVGKQLSARNQVQSHQSEIEKMRRQRRRAEVESQLNLYRSELKQIPSDEKVLEALQEATKAHRQALSSLREKENELSAAKQEHSLARQMYKEDQKEHKDFLEAKAANAIFKRLEPTCCPHCQASITKERLLREREEHSCSVCGESILDSEMLDEDAEFLMSELEDRVKASKEMLEQTKALVNNSESQMRRLVNQVSTCETERKHWENQFGRFEKHNALERNIFGLEVLLNEYQEVSEIDEQDSNLKLELNVIKAALKETTDRLTTLQQDLLEIVSTKIKEYAICFGMESITSATLTSNTSLKLIKDGRETSYSKCTDGEKLRLKVASIIAILSVSEKKGIGRHPGLLLIDSPKGEEMVENDVDKLISGLSELAKDLPHLQIIFAATSSESILRYVDESHLKHAKGDNFLW